MNTDTKIEVRFEPRPGNRVSVTARLGAQTASRIFSRASPEAELFLWLADQFRSEIRRKRTCAARRLAHSDRAMLYTGLLSSPERRGA